MRSYDAKRAKRGGKESSQSSVVCLSQGRWKRNNDQEAESVTSVRLPPRRVTHPETPTLVHPLATKPNSMKKTEDSRVDIVD